MIILTNKIKCNKCGDIIESKTTHDFNTCSCGAVSVDGGRSYLKRSGNMGDWTDLSEVRDLDDLLAEIEKRVVDEIKDYIENHCHTIKVNSKNRNVVYKIGLTRFLDNLLKEYQGEEEC